MKIYCASFGSIWWLRPGEDVTSNVRFTAGAALFNTTGFRSGSQERRNWTQIGLLRFNVGTCLRQSLNPAEITPGIYESSGVEQRGSQNRLLLERRGEQGLRPDAVVVCVRSETHGQIVFSGTWRSPGVRMIAASDYRGQQETLLLMAVGRSINTESGRWVCEWTGSGWEMVAC